MGRAKERGTLEERIAQSRANTAAEKERRKAEAKEWWDSLTEEEKTIQREKWAKQDKASARARSIMALAIGMGSKSGGI